MNGYELVLILRADVQDEDRGAVLQRVKDIITGDQGVVLRVDEWGKKRLAYEIKHMSEGYYYVLYFDATPSTLDEATRVLRISDTVLRFLAVRRTKPVSVPETTVSAESVAEGA